MWTLPNISLKMAENTENGRLFREMGNFFRHEEKQGGQVSGHPASFFNLPPPFFSDQPYKL